MMRLTWCGFVCFCLAPDASPLASAEPTLPGTQPLRLERPLDEVMLDGLHTFALREIEGSRVLRDERWRRDYSSAEAYEKSIAPHRARLRETIGAVDERRIGDGLERPIPLHDRDIGGGPEEAPADASKPISRYHVHSPVRWQVLDGVTAEGILLDPVGTVKANVIALPDADWTPEMFVGISDGVPTQAQIPLTLVANGCRVLVPTLISREAKYSGTAEVGFTNQPHREFVYRCAFPVGRHVIGYEVQKVLAAVDAFELLDKAEQGVNDRWRALHDRLEAFEEWNLDEVERALKDQHAKKNAPARDKPARRPLGVLGVGEGGLIALHAAALDPRIDAALVCGYFEPREGVWQEPVYRNVWRQLTEFGDAELAGMIAPRTLVIEACAAPEVAGPPPPRNGRNVAAPGRIRMPPLARVRDEFARARVHFEKLIAAERIALAVSGEDGTGPAGSEAALAAFAKGLGLATPLKPAEPAAKAEISFGPLVDPDRRQKRQLDELIAHTQQVMQDSRRPRARLWSRADRSSVAAWEKSVEPLRKLVHEEMIGKLPEPTMAINSRSRLVLDEPAFLGYEVMLDVYPDVIAGGILLLPKGIQEGERRPVVVCQHGQGGTPMDTIIDDENERATRVYRAFSRRLAERGFVVFAPQNPHRGEERFREVVRKGSPMGRSLFSYIIPQHARIVEWLGSMPMVDPQRIGFYGLSYGGNTALNVPPFVPGYALSICSASFNDWVPKIASVEAGFCFPFTREHEMPQWNLAATANHAECAWLISPRPFMVERGHDDSVSWDEWVAFEYARVRRHYVKLGIPERTEIEYFDGPHRINGEGTFEFLHRHLKRPKPE
ncbi:MAG: hypothetical protein WED34_03290 [Planctomycetales bacterium]